MNINIYQIKKKNETQFQYYYEKAKTEVIEKK